MKLVCLVLVAAVNATAASAQSRMEVRTTLNGRQYTALAPSNAPGHVLPMTLQGSSECLTRKSTGVPECHSHQEWRRIAADLSKGGK